VQPLVSAVHQEREDHKQANELDLHNVLPVFVPAALVASEDWKSSFRDLRAPGVALAWAARGVDNIQRYMSCETQRKWEAQGIDWGARAIENLRAGSREPLGNGALFRDNGETWLISLAYPDGLGPSRLLLTEELVRIFPKGYRIALPDQNRAFAFARDLDAEDADTVENLVERSFSNSARPLAPGIFEPGDLVAV